MVFDKIWFAKYQKTLLKFANTKLGKKILCIDNPNRIIRITPNSITWREGKLFKTEFRMYDKYGKRLYFAFKPIWKLVHAWDMAWYPKFNMGFDQLTAYPDADVETTTVDGYIERAGVQNSWTDIRGATGTTAYPSATSGTFQIIHTDPAVSGQYQNVARSIFLFDTSSLTASATITAATFSVYVTAKTDNFTDSMRFTTSTPAGNTNLITADLTALGTTANATDIALSAVSTSAYNDFTLNATGLGNISQTGVSKFGLRSARDADNSEPAWVANNQSSVTGYFADQTGTSNDPKLVVTYTVPSSNFFFISQ